VEFFHNKYKRNAQFIVRMKWDIFMRRILYFTVQETTSQQHGTKSNHSRPNYILHTNNFLLLIIIIFLLSRY